MKSKTEVDFNALLEAARKGEQGAIDKLGEIYFPLIKKIGSKAKYSLFLGEDAVGEGCLAFCEVLRSFTGISQDDFENYLCRAIYNRLNRMLYKHYRKDQAEILPNEDDECNDLNNAYDLDLDDEFYLNELLQVLTARQGEILKLKLAGYQEKEIGDRIGVSRRTLFYELKAIREKLCTILL